MAEGKSSRTASILKTKFKDSKQNNCQNFIKKDDVLCVKRKILEIIESLSEGGVTSQKLLESCHMLTKNDYADVIDERNIQNLCGYPLCSNHLQVLKQQFRIISKVNRVYDITEMKGFCSNTCCKASCYLKQQLSDIAVWFREDPVTLSLLSDANNRGSMGEVVPLYEENLYETDGEAKCEKEEWFTKEDKKLLHEELSKCTDYFKNLEVAEKGVQTTTDVGKKQFNNALPKNVTFSEGCDNEKTKNYEIYIESDAESDYNDDNEYFPLEENKNSSEKLMPIVRANKVKAILINPDTKSVIDFPPLMSSPISLCTIKGILKNWITPATVEFLSGKLSDDLSPAISAVDLLSDKEHMPQANKKNDVQRVLNEVQEIMPEIQNATNNKTLPPEETDLTKTINLQIEMVNQYFRGENLRREKKKQSSTVKFKTGHKGSVKLIKNEAPKLAVDPVPPPLDAKGQYDSESNLTAASELTKLPKVDSTSQNALRRQVVCIRLKNAFSDILPLIGLHYNVLGDTILHLVSTFRLTASNVVHKPNEWKSLAVVLFRLVMKSCLIKNKLSEGFTEEETFSLMLKKTPVCEHLSVHEIDEAIKGLFYCNTQSGKCK